VEPNATQGKKERCYWLWGRRRDRTIHYPSIHPAACFNQNDTNTAAAAAALLLPW